MLTKTFKAKIEKYNKYQSKADDLRYEIEDYLDNKYGINEENRCIWDGDIIQPYGMDGVCPIYDWGSRYFNSDMIDKIVAFIEEFSNRVGEKPDLFEVYEHFKRH